MNTRNQQLIEEYLASGGNVTRQETVDKLPEPHPNPTISHSIEYDLHTGKRIYQNLGKMGNILPLDETTLNYGD